MSGFDSLPDAKTATKERSFTPIPDAWYDLQVISTTGPNDNRDKTGKYYLFEIEVASGEQKGRKFRATITTQHQDPDKQAYGLGDLNKLCVNCGFGSYSEVKATKQLHFQIFRAKIVSKPQKDDQRYFNTNIVEYKFDINGVEQEETPVRAAGTAAPATTTAGAAGGKTTAAGAAQGADWRSRAGKDKPAAE
jgi:hypothetical protein